MFSNALSQKVVTLILGSWEQTFNIASSWVNKLINKMCMYISALFASLSGKIIFVQRASKIANYGHKLVG